MNTLLTLYEDFPRLLLINHAITAAQTITAPTTTSTTVTTTAMMTPVSPPEGLAAVGERGEDVTTVLWVTPIKSILPVPLIDRRTVEL